MRRRRDAQLVAECAEAAALHVRCGFAGEQRQVE
jgi:hypothetical protein